MHLLLCMTCFKFSLHLYTYSYISFSQYKIFLCTLFHFSFSAPFREMRCMKHSSHTLFNKSVGPENFIYFQDWRSEYEHRSTGESGTPMTEGLVYPNLSIFLSNLTTPITYSFCGQVGPFLIFLPDNTQGHEQWQVRVKPLTVPSLPTKILTARIYGTRIA